MTPAATPEALEQALAYLKPHETNGGTISLKAAKAREAVAVIEVALQWVTAERDEALIVAHTMREGIRDACDEATHHRNACLIAQRERDTATAEAASLRAEVEAKDRARDDALKSAIRAWSAKLHIPVTRMMSRELRAEFSAALARAATAGEGRSDV